jgi:hypothetical protein
VAITISDSYYWQVFAPGYTKQLFDTNTFRYYNKQAFIDRTFAVDPIYESSLEGDIARNDIVLMMFTEANYRRFCYGFIDELYFLLQWGDRIRFHEQRIRAGEEWMEQIREKSAQRGIPFDDMVRLDAIWLVKEELKKDNTN